MLTNESLKSLESEPPKKPKEASQNQIRYLQTELTRVHDANDKLTAEVAALKQQVHHLDIFARIPSLQSAFQTLCQ